MEINGIGANIEMWAPFVAALSGRQVITFDAPGTGQSSRTRQPVRMRRLSRVVTRLLDFGSWTVRGDEASGLVVHAGELGPAHPALRQWLVGAIEQSTDVMSAIDVASGEADG